MAMPIHIIFAGLPATGKTTIARQAAKLLAAVYLRIDSLEQTLAREGKFDVSLLGPAGYHAAAAIAVDNLRNNLSVVTDSVNPWPITRDLWLDASRDAGACSFCVELFCSDIVEHRRRVESRLPDIVGAQLPTWEDVCGREYVPWEGADLRIDTSMIPADKAVASLVEAVRKMITA